MSFVEFSKDVVRQSTHDRVAHPVQNADVPDKLAVSIPCAGEMLSIGRTSVYDLIKRGDLKSIKIGRRRLVLVDSIRALAECAVEVDR